VKNDGLLELNQAPAKVQIAQLARFDGNGGQWPSRRAATALRSTNPPTLVLTAETPLTTRLFGQ
jgi:hypothetical protein